VRFGDEGEFGWSGCVSGEICADQDDVEGWTRFKRILAFTISLSLFAHNTQVSVERIVP
jgi:hypothetical protein